MVANQARGLKERRVYSRWAIFGFLSAILSLVTGIMAGFGHHWGWWHFGTGFLILKWAVYGGLASIVISLIGIVYARPGGARKGMIWAMLGLVISLSLVAVPLGWINKAGTVPAIHDITTETDNPPPFEAILPLRKNAPNSAEYGGPDVAEQQKLAYPNLKPLVVAISTLQTFKLALDVAHDLGWHIVSDEPEQGRIEATATTFWFGFKDDIVVRITPVGKDSRVDVRSVSRVGRSDIGTNAARIRKYLSGLEQRIKDIHKQ